MSRHRQIGKQKKKQQQKKVGKPNSNLKLHKRKEPRPDQRISAVYAFCPDIRLSLDRLTVGGNTTNWLSSPALNVPHTFPPHPLILRAADSCGLGEEWCEQAETVVRSRETRRGNGGTVR